MSTAEVRTPPRTEAEIVADVVAVLLRQGVVPGTAQSLAAACRAAAVSVPLVQARFDRLGRNGYAYERPTDGPQLRIVRDGVTVDMPAPSVDVADLERRLAEKDRRWAAAEERITSLLGDVDRLEAELARTKIPRTAAATAVRKSARGNEREAADGTTERRCTRCERWKPADPKHFYVKRPETGALTSMCHDCRRAYQRERYLSVAKTEALNEARLEFVVGAGDDVVGLACSACRRPIEAGEKVAGESELHHSVCPG